MKKRIISCILTVFVAAGLLGGCGGSSREKAAEVSKKEETVSMVVNEVTPTPVPTATPTPAPTPSVEDEMNVVVDAFIAKVSSPDMSSYEKLKACWNYFMGFQFIASMEPDVHEEDWQYRAAMDYINYEAGECAMLACAVAACAKRLGYDPYVYHVPTDHSFVIIDDMYWDNTLSTVPSDTPVRDINYIYVFEF